MPDQHILIAGGAGFIGFNLTQFLLRQGFCVDCVDNLITGQSRHIPVLSREARYSFYHADITDPRCLLLLSGTKYDEIYHLACPTGVPNIKVFGEEMLKTCSTGTAHLLQLARTCGSRFVFASSAEIYGNPHVFPQREDYSGNVDPIGPRSAYEEGKRFAEALVALYAQKYHLDAKIVRIFNTFGPGMSPDDQRVIPQFLRMMTDGQPVHIYGDGSQRRSFLYINDLITGLELVCKLGRAGEAYNVGGTEELSINELYSTLSSLWDHRQGVEYHPHFTADHLARRPDTTKIRELGWKIRTTVLEGLTQTVMEWKKELPNWMQLSSAS